MNMDLPVDYTKLKPYEKRGVRLAYIAAQDNKCWHCKGDLDEEPPQEVLDKHIRLDVFPPGFLKNPIHLHHDHNTDMTIGAVHAYCNAVLWEWYGQ
jgi:hypothetical protein